MLQSRETTGTALRNGRPVAAVTVIEQADARIARIPRAGATSYSYRDSSRRLPSAIVFDEIFDDGLAAELDELVAAVGDVDRMRAQRDAGRSYVSLELSLD